MWGTGNPNMKKKSCFLRLAWIITLWTTMFMVSRKLISLIKAQVTFKATVTVLASVSPKLGNSGFANVFNKFSNLHLLHTRHYLDIAPGLQPTLFLITYANFPIEVLLSPISFCCWNANQDSWVEGLTHGNWKTRKASFLPLLPLQ